MNAFRFYWTALPNCRKKNVSMSTKQLWIPPIKSTGINRPIRGRTRKHVYFIDVRLSAETNPRDVPRRAFFDLRRRWRWERGKGKMETNAINTRNPIDTHRRFADDEEGDCLLIRRGWRTSAAPGNRLRYRRASCESSGTLRLGWSATASAGRCTWPDRMDDIYFQLGLTLDSVDATTAVCATQWLIVHN